MVRGIVLAAGRSSRMGRPKAGLRLGSGGPTFAQAVVDTLVQAGVEQVTVVAGAHPQAVREAVAAAPGVRVIDHPGWESGQLSSLVAGLDAVDDPGVDAVLVTLVDIPLVRVSTVVALLAAWRRSRAPVVRPALDGRHGHPVIFDRATFPALRAAPLEAGAKAVIAAIHDRVLNVETDDAGVFRDVDTPEDYAAIAPHGTD